MAEASKRDFSINYKGIDCTKVLMAILVVAIHTLQLDAMTLPVLVSKSYNILIGLAVPFFFVSSGFLLCNKLKIKDYPGNLQYMLGWLFRILRLYLVWTIIYLPYAVVGFCNENLGFLKSVVVYGRNVIFVGENYLSWPLWYLLAMIVAGMIYYLILLLRPRRFLPVLVVFAVSLVGIGYLIDSGLIQNGWYLSLFKNTRNGFFQGFPYMTIGFVVSAVGYSRNKLLMTILLFVGVIIQLLGYKSGSYVTIYSLFSIVLSSSDSITLNENVCKAFRLTSVVIYFVHMLWAGLLIFSFKINSLSLFVSSLLLSIMTSYLVVRNRKSKLVRFLFE